MADNQLSSHRHDGDELQSSQPQSRRAHRPESTIVQSFSADLDSMFGLNSEVDDLQQTVERKKSTVSSSERELLELEARLRETEERLARVSNSRHASPSRAPPPPPPTSAPPPQPQQHPLAQRPTYPDSRPPTAPRPQSQRAPDTQTLMQGMPGALPPDNPPPEPPKYATSSGTANEYVMVERGGARERGYA
nr:hypothetical protein CFP56_00238 [Quercus suber]